MADLPILFSGAMVRALLREIEQRGTGKTQTRRIINPQPTSHMPGYWRWDGPYHGFIQSSEDDLAHNLLVHAARYDVGDRLYVRETWAPLDALTHSDPGVQALANRGFFRADESTVEEEISRWRPGIHMPRWASRITLIVTDVRVQRLQEISTADAVAEGALSPPFSDQFADVHAIEMFRCLWDSLNADRGYGWEANPWVCAISFRPIAGNIDQIAEAA